ncbi:DNA-directed RNA polymerase subunit beta [Mesobacillus persicus]|uniref:DNA-directed RNA polymerase subunit beta n=1 Tax=Mesobacillus persicus TaxID=930146 RepID=A0A1H8H2T6_9BACI|nr:DNA-directed RNA polymerase subunit beta [Mesobacillus persicus]SEN50284.1 DNA-directed RNA polymerase subunit beta [Mesobacillus persicus]
MAVNSKQEALTREQVKKSKEKVKGQERKKVRVRLIPIWLRLLIIIALLALSTILGAAVGYGILGNGEPMDVFEKTTWMHMLDLVNHN